jgi:hypothetical protein
VKRPKPEEELTEARAAIGADLAILEFIRKCRVCPDIFIPGAGREAVRDSNESHSAYLVKKRLFANVTNLSHAIAYIWAPFSVFEPE